MSIRKLKGFLDFQQLMEHFYPIICLYIWGYVIFRKFSTGVYKHNDDYIHQQMSKSNYQNLLTKKKLLGTYLITVIPYRLYSDTKFKSKEHIQDTKNNVTKNKLLIWNGIISTKFPTNLSQIW